MREITRVCDRSTQPSRMSNGIEGKGFCLGSPRAGPVPPHKAASKTADCGLLSPDLAAGIRRVKGVKKIGVRLGNWLTAEQSQKLWQAPRRPALEGKT